MRYIETDVMSQVIKRHIIDERKKTKKERGKYFYASEAYLPHNPKDSGCARQLGYKILGYEPTEEREDMYPIFALGELFHDFIQRLFVKEKLATQVEEFTIMYDDDGKYYWIRRDANKIIIKTPVEIHGRLDLKFKVEMSSFIADIKTISEGGWRFLNNKPKEPHYAQIQLYLHDFVGKGIDKGFLLYVNKSSGEMKEFLIQYDKDYVEEYLENYKKLYERITQKGLPSRHFKSGEQIPWQCKYCGFTKECLGLSIDEVSQRVYLRYPEEGEDDK